MSEDGRLGVGLLGLGVVGGGVARFLLERQSSAHAVSVPPVTLRSILVRDARKPRSLSVPSGLLTTDPAAVLGDAGTHLIVEVMGGEYPAVDYIQEALGRGKHVVTANKEVMAKHGPELLARAAEAGVQLRFEASAGAGIPIIGPLAEDLLANDISSIHAIINGTTNFILTKMAREGMGFEEALLQAQELGYAEADPSNDVEGVDAAYKLAILSSLAFRTRVHASDVFVEGITRLQAVDFQYAQELGYAIKLLAIGRKDNGALQGARPPHAHPGGGPHGEGGRRGQRHTGAGRPGGLGGLLRARRRLLPHHQRRPGRRARRVPPRGRAGRRRRPGRAACRLPRQRPRSSPSPRCGRSTTCGSPCRTGRASWPR